MSIFNGANLVASGRWIGAAGPKDVGATAALTAAGVYTLTLDRGLGANECQIMITPEAGTVSVSPGVVQTSATVKTVILKDTTNANINANFEWMVFQTPGT